MKLINGDAIQELKKLEDNSIDCIITSPPYYNVKDYAHWDSYSNYLEWLKSIFTISFDILKDGRMCIVNISNIIIPRKNRQSESKRIPLAFHFVHLMEDIGFKFLEDIIWVKPNGSVPNRNGGFYRHRKPVAYKPNCVNEYVLVFQKPFGHLIDYILKNYPEDIVADSLVEDDYEKTNMWKINPVSDKNHPAPFPIELTDKLVKYYSFKGDIILDMFMGTGTTGVSCNNFNREFIGIELNEEYYKYAVKRVKYGFDKC